jgi:hypothetical protein
MKSSRGDWNASDDKVRDEDMITWFSCKKVIGKLQRKIFRT